MVRCESAREYFSRAGHYKQGHAPKETTECFKYVRSLSNGPVLHAFKKPDTIINVELALNSFICSEVFWGVGRLIRNCWLLPRWVRSKVPGHRVAEHSLEDSTGIFFLEKFSIIAIS